MKTNLRPQSTLWSATPQLGFCAPLEQFLVYRTVVTSD